MLKACLFFFFNDTATTEIYPLPLHDALPISKRSPTGKSPSRVPADTRDLERSAVVRGVAEVSHAVDAGSTFQTKEAGAAKKGVVGAGAEPRGGGEEHAFRLAENMSCGVASAVPPDDAPY